MLLSFSAIPNSSGSDRCTHHGGKLITTDSKLSVSSSIIGNVYTIFEWCVSLTFDILPFCLNVGVLHGVIVGNPLGHFSFRPLRTHTISLELIAYVPIQFRANRLFT